jgi:predicted aspartyl protease
MARIIAPIANSKDLEKFGPRLEIEVGPPIISQQNIDAGSENLKRFSRLPALIDTGASRTVLTPQAIEKLNLPLVDYTIVSRAGGLDRTPVYAASIQFPRYKIAPIELIQIICCDLPEQPIHCLLGRDILSRWSFAYDGKTGEWIIEEGRLPIQHERSKAIYVDAPAGVYEVFISHANEDKPFVNSLVAALRAADISVWYDKDEVKWGDDLRSTIDKGVLNSRFAIVVFSKAFMRRRWTEHELNALFARERTGKTIILPLWHGVTQEDIGEYSPAFVDRFALDSQKNSIAEIVQSLKLRLRSEK